MALLAAGSRAGAYEGSYGMWFDPAGSLLRRLAIAAVLFFFAGTYMYVWCELVTPRWYNGVFRRRFGALVPSGLRLP